MKYLLRFALWLVYRHFDQLKKAALPLARAADGKKDVSGEYKRHQVYARMLKKFPSTPRRDIGLAIELVVRSL